MLPFCKLHRLIALCLYHMHHLHVWHLLLITEYGYCTLSTQQQPKCWKAFHCLLLNQFFMGPHEDQVLFNTQRAASDWLGCGLLWFECRLLLLFAFRQVNDNEIGSQVSYTVGWEINPMKLNWLSDKTIYQNFWVIDVRYLWALEGSVQEIRTL